MAPSDSSFWKLLSYAKIIKLFISFILVFCILLLLLSAQFNTIFDEDKKSVQDDVTLTELLEPFEDSIISVELVVRNSTIANQNDSLPSTKFPVYVLKDLVVDKAELMLSSKSESFNVSSEDNVRELFVLPGIITERMSDLNAPG